jgi:acyl-CoA reductase-like NAD-dependent aldehyde dehydrogenase
MQTCVLQVHDTIAKAQDAARVWRRSSFAQRRHLLSVLLKFILSHQEEICRCVCVCGGGGGARLCMCACLCACTCVQI